MIAMITKMPLTTIILIIMRMTMMMTMTTIQMRIVMI